MFWEASILNIELMVLMHFFTMSTQISSKVVSLIAQRTGKLLGLVNVFMNF